jgi:L-threonylcarbamoyladenylate synthase
MVADCNTIRLSATDRGIRAAVSFLRKGGLVAFPTETVYGLGADARSERAVAAIYRAKGRPAHNPVIVHVASAEEAAALIDLTDAGRTAAEAFWPGPLTLVAPVRGDSGIAPICRAGAETLAVRVPAHPLARRLLAAFAGPIAAPSANRSGQVSPTHADHVMEELLGRIDGVVDGGACDVGLESTILGFDADGSPRLLRPGGVSLEALEAALGPVGAAAIVEDQTPNAPGQLSSHYAPGAAVRLDAAAPELGEAWLGFGPDPARGSAISLNLSPSGALEEAAAPLFAALRQLDEWLDRRGSIAVASIPEHGLGRAINDRLRRAAAPRG